MISLRLIALICLFHHCSLAYGAATGGSKWNYDTNGPDEWPHKFPTCNGKKQSPINIETHKLEFDGNLRPFKFHNYDSILKWNVTHNGHTVVINQLNDNFSKNVSVTGSDFDTEFKLLQFHFHWGYNDYHGSEHYINGDKYPLEMHLVHISKEGKLAVLGFLFKITEKSNPNLEFLLQGIKTAKNEHFWQNVSFSLNSILPDYQERDRYYRYSGSLTTPPCTEGVTWNVFVTNIGISNQQMANFRINDLKLNYREPQRLYSRPVYSSFPQSKKAVAATHSEAVAEAANPSCKNASSKNGIFNRVFLASLFLALVSIF